MSLEGAPSEKTGHIDASCRCRYQRMGAVKVAEVLAKVASSDLPKRRVLGGLGVPRSTYYWCLGPKTNKDLRTRQQVAGPMEQIDFPRSPSSTVTAVHWIDRPLILWQASPPIGRGSITVPN